MPVRDAREGALCTARPAAREPQDGDRWGYYTLIGPTTMVSGGLVIEMGIGRLAVGEGTKFELRAF